MGQEMLGAAIDALLILTDPTRFMFMTIGVLMGLVLGIIPGLGGVVGMTMLLPFTYSLDPFAAIAVMLGLGSVINTSDTIPAVLFGVPGTAGCAATVLDGYPLARQGQAGRALGASFMASLLGGLFGAFLLGLSIPVLRPMLLIVASPELLAMCVFGISLAAALSGGAVFKGLAAGAFGLLLSTVGEDNITGTMRWTFGTVYLWSGIPLVPIALGIFAVPELADLAISRTKLVQTETLRATSAGQWQGVKDVFRNKFLLLRCSGIGAVVGSIPGIGSAVIDWLAYGHAARTEKGAAESFGKGDIRGVIASESSNNAKEGGALVPTIAFGVPGSASMAILLAMFLMQGIVPGPNMLTAQLDLTYTMVWTVAAGNVIGAGICFLFANQLAKIVLVRPGILVPVVLVIVYLGAFQGSSHWGDIYILLGCGLLGWIMKRHGWPRPPLILGVVLGAMVERYLFISVQAYAAGFLMRPIVIGILVLTAIGLVRPLLRQMRDRRTGAKLVLGFDRNSLSRPDTWFVALAVLTFGYAIVTSAGWRFSARIVPQIVAIFGFVCAALQLAMTLFTRPDPTASKASIIDLTTEFEGLPPREVAQRGGVVLGWLVLFLAMALIVGLLPAALLFIIAWMRVSGGERWKTILPVAAAITIIAYFLFHKLLVVPWPPALIGQWFPALREATHLL